MNIKEPGDVFLLNKYEKAIRFLLYAIVTWVVFINFIQIQIGGTLWKTDDWLINYQGGYIRRGLIGEIIYNLSPDDWLLWLVFIIQSFLYIFICHFVLEKFFSKERSVLDGVILFSPAFIFLFPFYYINAGMRKELMAFMSFVLLLEATKKNKKDVLLFLSFVVFLVGVFSHEMIALFAFIFIYAFLIRSTHSSALKILFVSLLIIVTSSGIVFSAIYHGDIYMADVICSSLTLKGVDSDICEGAIFALSGTMLSEVIDVRSRFPGQLIYVPLFILAFLPVVFFDWKKYYLFIFIGFVSVFPLFFVATDWGRWIHIYMTFVFLLFLYDDDCRSEQKLSKPLLFFVVVYLISWRIPHTIAVSSDVSGAIVTIPSTIWHVISVLMSPFL